MELNIRSLLDRNNFLEKEKLEIRDELSKLNQIC